MLTVLLTLLCAPLGDTTSVRVTGTVSDSSGAPVAEAEVRLDSLPWRAVQKGGSYVLLAATGVHTLSARAVGYEPVEFPVVVPATPLRIDIRLDRAHELPGVRVEASATASSGTDASSGFDERRRNAGGFFLDSAQVAKRGASRTSELLRSVPGVTLFPHTNEFGVIEYTLVMRGITTVRGEACPIQYYLDGHPFPQVDNIDRIISPKQIAAVEVYSGGSTVPLRFHGPTSQCGVIVIWTRR